MQIIWRSALSLFLLTALSAVSQAQEWTRFRGPNGTGLSDTKFPPTFTEKDTAWKIELPGGGHSSPVLWGSKLFITSSDEETGRQTALCINADTGATIWRRDFDGRKYTNHLNNTYASSTPAVDADYVYLCSSTPEDLKLTALDHTGKDVWVAHLGPFSSQHGGGQSPVLIGDIVLLSDQQEGKPSFLFGLDRKTGQVKWRAPRAMSDKFCPACPTIYEPAGGAPQAVFISKSDGFTGYDPLTGKLLWQVKDNTFTARTVGSALLYNGMIFGSCGDGPKGFELVAVRAPADGKPAEKLWLTKDDTPYVPTMLVKNGMLFGWGANGILICRQPETGKLIWSHRAPGAEFYSSPVCAGETIYNLSRKGELVAIAAKDKYELLGQTPFNEIAEATPAIVNGKMYIRTYTHLYCMKGS